MITYATIMITQATKQAQRKGGITMRNTEEMRKAMVSSDTEEVAKILETLDENSIVLARTYMTALSDRQKIEKAKLERLAVAAV